MNPEENKFLSDQDIKSKILGEYNSQSLKTNDFPTEIIEIPSKGWFYPIHHPLSSGKLEMRYMTAKDEDILTSKNLRKQKVVLERLIQALIVTPGVYVKDVLAVDFFALMLAARVLGYGKDYEVEVQDEDVDYKQKVQIDLTSLEEINTPPVNEMFREEYKNKNEFNYILPKSGKNIKWKFLTYKEDLDLVNKVIAKGKNETSMTDALKAQIIEIDGERNPERISLIVENMLALDSKALRTYIENSKPGIDTTIKYMSDISGEEVSIDLPLTAEFFWPTT